MDAKLTIPNLRILLLYKFTLSLASSTSISKVYFALAASNVSEYSSFKVLSILSSLRSNLLILIFKSFCSFSNALILAVFSLYVALNSSIEVFKSEISRVNNATLFFRLSRIPVFS